MSRRPEPLAQVSDFDIRLLKIYRSVWSAAAFRLPRTYWALVDQQSASR